MIAIIIQTNYINLYYIIITFYNIYIDYRIYYINIFYFFIKKEKCFYNLVKI